MLNEPLQGNNNKLNSSGGKCRRSSLWFVQLEYTLSLFEQAFISQWNVFKQ